MTPKKEWREAFLAALRDAPVITYAANAAGVSRNFVYEQRRDDESFRSEWEDALQQGVDKLEKVCFDRANAGESDTLAIFLLKSHRPEKYRETVRNEHTGANGAPIEMISSRERLRSRIEEIHQRGLNKTAQEALLGGAGNEVAGI